MNASFETGARAAGGEVGMPQIGARERFALFALMRLFAAASLVLDPILRSARSVRF